MTTVGGGGGQKSNIGNEYLHQISAYEGHSMAHVRPSRTRVRAGTIGGSSLLIP